MAAGAGAIALASVPREEHRRWQEAAHREGQRYGVKAAYVQAGLAGRNLEQGTASLRRRNWLDWALVVLATAVFVGLAAVSRTPEIDLNWHAAAILVAAMLVWLITCVIALWKVTRFS